MRTVRKLSFTTLNSVAQQSDSWWSTSDDRRYQGEDWDTSKNPHAHRREWHWENFRLFTQFHNHYIDADRAIAIEFFGRDQGVVDITSSNDVIVDGTLINIGTTTIEADRIRSTSAGGTIQSNDVTLNAQNGIDNVALESVSSSTAGSVTATSTAGDIDLEYRTGNVRWANLNAVAGDIHLTARGAIEGGSFKGNSITLASNQGSISGTVRLGTATDHTLTATAAGDITLTSSGDLRVNQVQSTQGGDVTLQTNNGDLLDGHTDASESESVLTELEAFAASDAVARHIEHLEIAGQGELDEYWRGRNLAPVNRAVAVNAGLVLFDHHSHNQFGGQTFDQPSVVLGIGNYDVGEFGIAENTASSFHLKPGYSATFFSNAGFQGAAITYRNHNNFARSYVLPSDLNNNVSSLTINPLGSRANYSNELTITNHGFQTGDQIIYQIGDETTAIGGLISDGTYYVRVIDDHTITLAATRSHALAGTHQINIAVTIESQTGTHVFTGYQADDFDPNTYTFIYSDAQRAQLQQDGYTNAEIANLEATQTSRMKELHTRFGSPTFYDPTYTYEISQAEQNTLQQELSNTVTTLKAQLNLLGNAQAFEYFFTLLNEEVGLATEVANVIAHNITLTNYNSNNIGGQAGQNLVINRNQLLSLLNTEQQAALVSAETKGLIQRQGNSLIISPREDLDVEATGLVTANSKSGNIYLGSNGPLTLGQVSASNEVQIRSSGEIIDGNGNEANIIHGSRALVLPSEDRADLEIHHVNRPSILPHHGVRSFSYDDA